MKTVKSRADCDAPCFEQLKATHLRASPKQQALLDVLLQLIKHGRSQSVLAIIKWLFNNHRWIQVVYNTYIILRILFCAALFSYSSHLLNRILITQCKIWRSKKLSANWIFTSFVEFTIKWTLFIYLLPIKSLRLVFYNFCKSYHVFKHVH